MWKNLLATLGLTLTLGCLEFDPGTDNFTCNTDSDCIGRNTCSGFDFVDGDPITYCDRVEATVSVPFSIDVISPFLICDSLAGPRVTTTAWLRSSLNRDESFPAGLPTEEPREDCLVEVTNEGAAKAVCPGPADARAVELWLRFEGDIDGQLTTLMTARGQWRLDDAVQGLQVQTVETFDLDIDEVLPATTSDRCAQRAVPRQTFCGQPDAVQVVCSQCTPSPENLSVLQCPLPGYFCALTSFCYPEGFLQPGDACNSSFERACDSLACSTTDVCL